MWDILYTRGDKDVILPAVAVAAIFTTVERRGSTTCCVWNFTCRNATCVKHIALRLQISEFYLTCCFY